MADIGQAKVCKSCERELPLEAFAKDSKGKLGRRARCKECISGSTVVINDTIVAETTREDLPFSKIPIPPGSVASRTDEEAATSQEPAEAAEGHQIATGETTPAPEDTPPTKVCPRCGEEKPRDKFGKSKRAKDGLRSYCKACDSAASKASRAKHVKKEVEEKEVHADG